MKHSRAFQNLRRHGRLAGFTLIEMMVVIGIIGILTALTGVALRGLNGSTSRHTAVNALMGVLDQARMVAISDGRPTYVVFVSEPVGQTQNVPTSNLPDSMWGRAYALFEDPPITDGMTKAAPVQRSGWLYLPTGIAFKCDASSDPAHVPVTANPQPQGDTTTFNVQSRTNTATVAMTLPYVRFDATGQVVDYQNNLVDANSPTLRVLLFEGIANSDGTEIATHRAVTTGTAGKNATLDEIILKSTTGRAAYTLDPVNNLATTQ